MIVDHHYFQLPENMDAVVWRYLSFTKFVSLLSAEALHFARSDKFEDPFEGTVPAAVREYVETLFSERFDRSTGMADEFMTSAETMRMYTYVNCWHMNVRESDAMWRLYCQQGEGVAIQSTVRKLHNELDIARTNVYLGKVKYVDPERIEPDAFLNGMTSFIFKRPSFEHEQELRAVTWIDNPEDLGPEGITLSPGESTRALAVNLTNLVDKVIVSPMAPAWFSQIVESTIRQFGFRFNIEHSKLYKLPEHRQNRELIGNPTAPVLSVEAFSYIQKQHLIYTELQVRERARLQENQSIAIREWIAEVREELRTRKVGNETALDVLGGLIVTPIPVSELLDSPTFRLLYFLIGKVENIVSEVFASILPERERDLLLRRIVFIYTEHLAMPQLALIRSAQRELRESGETPDSAIIDMLQKIKDNHLKMSQLMNARKI